MQKQAMLNCISRVWEYANQNSRLELEKLRQEIETASDLTLLAFDLDDAIDRVLVSLEV